LHYSLLNYRQVIEEFDLELGPLFKSGLNQLWSAIPPQEKVHSRSDPLLHEEVNDGQGLSPR
jgi:hypothetical protein